MEIAFPCIHGSVGPAALIPWGMQNYLGPTRLLGFYLISRASPSSQGATQCKPKLFTFISNIVPPGLLFYSTQKDCYSNYLEPARAARDPEVFWFTQQASTGAIFSNYCISEQRTERNVCFNYVFVRPGTARNLRHCFPHVFWSVEAPPAPRCIRFNEI